MSQDKPEFAIEHCETHDIELPNADWDAEKEEWIQTHIWQDKHGQDKRKDVVTDALKPGKRTTGNIELVLIEAELAADGKELQNPAVPVGAIQDEVRERLDQEDLDPAWKVCDRVDYPPLP